MKKKMVLKTLLVLFIMASFGLQSLGATYYVAKTGSDANTCTQAQNKATPKLTIVSGLSCLSAGDTLIVKAGTYTEDLMSNQPPSGTNWTTGLVTIKANAGDTVTLKPTNVDVVRLSNKAQYISYDGFVIDGNNTAAAGIRIRGIDATAAHHIRITNCTIQNVKGTGMLPEEFSHHDEILNNTVQNWGTTVSHHAIYNAADDTIIEGNTFHPGPGHTLVMQGGSGIRPERCIVRNNYLPGRSAEGGIHESGAEFNTYYNNIVVDHSAFGIRCCGVNNTGTKVYNNTVYKGVNGIVIRGGGSTNEVKNNIVWQTTGQAIVDDSMGVIVSNNITLTDPLFVDPANGDFHLQSGSPAIDVGLDLSPDVTDDFDKISRRQGSAYDAGAYEFVGDVPRPAAPTNLRIVTP